MAREILLPITTRLGVAHSLYLANYRTFPDYVLVISPADQGIDLSIHSEAKKEFGLPRFCGRTGRRTLEGAACSFPTSSAGRCDRRADTKKQGNY
jgi:hypothetical protein